MREGREEGLQREKGSCDIGGAGTVMLREASLDYLSRTCALCRPSEPRAAASCRAVFFILRRMKEVRGVLGGIIY